MLKKLLKYDWKSVSVLLLILHGILLAYTLIGRIGIAFGLSRYGETLTGAASEAYGIVSGIYILLYVFFILAITITTYVFLAVRFHKNLFSDEGYLTHTLPVSPAKLMWSKILVSWAWIAIDAFFVVASVLMLMLFKQTFEPFKNVVCEFFSILAGAYGMQNQVFIILLILTVLAQIFGCYTTLVLFSMCLGSLFKTHKILGAVVSFFGINILLSIVSTIIMFAVPGWSSTGAVSVTAAANGGFIGGENSIFLFTFIWNLALAVLFFLGSRYILSKKLNLE